MLRPVWVDVHSWVGSSVSYASHYYGKFKRRREDGPVLEVDITKPLSRKEARRRNKAENTSIWMAGAKCNGFTSKDELYKVAAATYKQHFPDAVILLLNVAGDCGPMRALDGPPGFIEEANRICDRCEELDWYETRWGVGWNNAPQKPEMDRLEKEFEELLARFGHAL
jgi:hypothetical protein